MLKNRNRKFEKGFSFVEVMVSVFILTIGIVAVLDLMAKNIKNSTDSRDSIIASELAQEGVELIRNVRDNYFTAGGGISNLGVRNNCIIDYRGSLTCNFIGFANRKLYYKNNFYVHDSSGSEETKFYRKIDIENYGSNGKKITSMTWWNGDASIPAAANCNIGKSCIYVEDVLTDWAK